MSELVGFSNLPNQLHRRAVRQGFTFTVMVMGQSGLGKSTFINSLFLRDLRANRDEAERYKSTVDIKAVTQEIEERSVKLKLTIVDTPGFGDSINNENSWAKAVEYIDAQFHSYLEQESRTKRTHIEDTRVHVVLYFISPNSRGLRQLDIEAMKALQHKANIVPLIAKSDTLTAEERARLKKQIMDDIVKHQIHVYSTIDESEEDPELKAEAQVLQQAMPFAAMGAEGLVEKNGTQVRGRKYPWGVVELENEEHCDYVKIRSMLIRSHMQDLKELTNMVHYENFRASVLERNGGAQPAQAHMIA